MALDWIQVGLSIFIFIIYLFVIFLLLVIRYRLKGKSKTAFTFIISSIFFLMIRRLQTIFTTSDILAPIPYSTELITLIFVLLFFMGVLFLYKSLKSSEMSHKSRGYVFRDYKKRLERIH